MTKVGNDSCQEFRHRQLTFRPRSFGYNRFSAPSALNFYLQPEIEDPSTFETPPVTLS